MFRTEELSETYGVLCFGQRNCSKHVEFYSQNKFEKLVHPVGFIIWILLQKLTAPQLLKKFPLFYGTRRFITTFTSIRLCPCKNANCLWAGQEIARIVWNPKFHYFVFNIVFIRTYHLSLARLIQFTSPHFAPLWYILMLPSHLSLGVTPYPSLPPEEPRVPFFRPHTSVCPVHHQTRILAASTL